MRLNRPMGGEGLRTGKLKGEGGLVRDADEYHRRAWLQKIDGAYLIHRPLPAQRQNTAGDADR